MTNMVDASGTTKYTYTADGRLFTEDGPFASDTVTNFYLGRVRTGLGLQQPAGVWTNGFWYDGGRRLASVKSPAGTFGYGYQAGQASSLPLGISLPNTSYITNFYDGVARLTGTYLKNSSHTVLDKDDYLYDSGHERTRHTRADDTALTFSYDKIGQLAVTRATNFGGTLVSSETKGYFYDAGWNLARRTNSSAGSTTTFTVDSKNQLTGGPTSPYTSDANGNLTGYSTWFTYEYDAENRLVAWQYYGTARTEFTYDGQGRLRVKREFTYDPYYTWWPTSETRYVYDGMRVIQERDGSNVPTVSYTRGNDLSGSLERAGGIGGLLARSHGYSAGNWSTHNFYHADGGGNVTYLVNSSQTLAASYKYDAYGNIVSSSGSLASANSYRFSSKELFHAGVDFYNFGYRWYDPNLQRWLNRDPLGEPGFHVIRRVAEGKTRPGRLTVGAELIAGPNLYWFVGNRPINVTDPLGLQGYGNPVSGPNGPVGPSSPYVPGGPYYPNGYLYTPPPDPVGDCISRCMGANGYGYALAGLGVGYGSGAATIPLKGGVGALGSGRYGTTGLSLLGQPFRNLGRFLNPYADAVCVASASYIAGLAISCSALCSSDSDSF